MEDFGWMKHEDYGLGSMEEEESRTYVLEGRFLLLIW